MPLTVQAPKHELNREFAAIYAICIPDRVAHMVDEMACLGVDFTVSPATLVADMPPLADLRAQKKIAPDMPTYRESCIAVHLSHVRVLERFLADGTDPDEAVLIFEDDIVAYTPQAADGTDVPALTSDCLVGEPCTAVPDAFNAKVALFLRHVREVERARGMTWDTLWLGFCWDHFMSRRYLGTGVYEMVLPRCPHAYAIKRRAIPGILGEIVPQTDLHGDRQLAIGMARQGLFSLGAYPPLFVQNRGGLESQNGNFGQLHMFKEWLTHTDMWFPPENTCGSRSRSSRSSIATGPSVSGSAAAMLMCACAAMAAGAAVAVRLLRRRGATVLLPQPLP
jgi:hypothetical protein